MTNENLDDRIKMKDYRIIIAERAAELHLESASKENRKEYCMSNIASALGFYLVAGNPEMTNHCRDKLKDEFNVKYLSSLEDLAAKKANEVLDSHELYEKMKKKYDFNDENL